MASGIVGGRAFTGLFHKAVEDAHRALFKQDENTVTLTLADVGTVLTAALEQVRSRRRSRARVDRAGRARQARHRRPERRGCATSPSGIELLAIFLVVLALVLAGGALALSTDRRATVVDLGVGVAVAGVLLVVAYAVAALDRRPADGARGPGGGARRLGRVPRRPAHGGLDPRRVGRRGGRGRRVAVEPLPFGEPLRAAGRLDSPRARPAPLRVVRGVAFIAVGVLILVDKEGALTLLVTVLGIYLIFEGVGRAPAARLPRPTSGADARTRPGSGLPASVRRLAVS